MNCAPVEEWRDVPGLEGIYQASTRGRIRSLPRVIEQMNRWGQLRPTKRPGTVLKPWNCNSGYLAVYLCADGEQVATSVHRVICATFHGTPADRPEVNHIDGNKKNNAPVNLEWTTHAGNGLHRYDVLHVHRAVIAIPKSGGEPQEFSSSKRAAEVLVPGNASARGNIRMALVGHVPSAYGYLWRYADASAAPPQQVQPVLATEHRPGPVRTLQGAAGLGTGNP